MPTAIYILGTDILNASITPYRFSIGVISGICWVSPKQSLLGYVLQKVGMSAIRLAFTFIRVPRLFAALFLLPLLLSLLLVYAQLVLTALALKTFGKDTDGVQSLYEERRQTDLGRRLVFGKDYVAKPVRICRWIEQASAIDGVVREVPPDPACAPDRLDIALQVANPASFEPQSYSEVLYGLTERLHICKTCRPDAVIQVGPNGNETHAYSSQALILLRLSLQNESTQAKFLDAMRSLDASRKILGDLHFHSSGLRKSLNTSRMEGALALVFNMASLVIISLWLALKAHRKVLDYFARNGALLPMVAATGKGVFYAAIWILTLTRVAAFVCAAVPITFFGLTGLLSDRQLDQMIKINSPEFVLWVLALLASLSLATLIASIADLKHRHQFFSIGYRYVPLFFCLAGGFVWTGSFLFDGPFFGYFRALLSALPIVGAASILVAPVMQPQLSVLVVHLLLTSVLLVVALKRNARWFAAHLEEL